MKFPRRIGSAAGLTAAALAGFAALAGPAGAAMHGQPSGASRVVFVQTDNTGGNQVVAYDRAADGIRPRRLACGPRPPSAGAA